MTSNFNAAVDRGGGSGAMDWPGRPAVAAAVIATPPACCPDTPGRHAFDTATGDGAQTAHPNREGVR